jgi:hypothetical protein
VEGNTWNPLRTRVNSSCLRGYGVPCGVCRRNVVEEEYREPLSIKVRDAIARGSLSLMPTGAVAHSLVARASLLTETRRGAGLG